MPPALRWPTAVLWLAAQGVLVASAGSRADGALGFRMFPEASTLEIRLARRTARGELLAPGGEWSARDADGQLRHFSWRARVRDPVLSRLDARVFASYGAAAQLERLARALDDVAAHLDGDGETRALVAHVSVRRNGRPAEAVTLQSRERDPR